MPQSLVQIYVHVIFSTKDRRPFLKESAFREQLHGYLSGICRKQDTPSLIVDGAEDHVHLLCRLGKTKEIASLIRELKRDSSKWIKRENESLRAFRWQNGYGAFSVSPSHLHRLEEYIANQMTHHKRETFQDEFRRICKKYGVQIDEQYVWD